MDKILKKKSSDQDLIEIKNIIKFFSRNKKSISLTSFIFFLLSCFYGLSLKRIWEGQFEIVLKTENSSNKTLNLKNPMVTNLLRESNDLQTQVGILESSSVLMPIFEFVKNEQNNKINKKFTFSNWKKNNLKIALKKKTSILKISYRDEKKLLIIDVLNKMTDAYQKYSGKSRRDKLQLSKKYFNEQINLFKKKSTDSFRNVQEFAIENDLRTFSSSDRSIFSDSLIDEEDRNSSTYLLSNLRNIDLEAIRVSAADKIRNIDSQIEKINNLEDTEDILYISSFIPALNREGLPQSLKALEQQIYRKEFVYSKEDKTIKDLYREKDLMIKLLKRRALGMLKAERLKFESRLVAATRPKGVFSKYKELLRQAARDEKTLIDLEKNLISVKLKEAQYEKPWELITKPTLLSYPVAPQRKNIGIFGLAIGFFAGIILSLYREKKSALVFDPEVLEDIFNSTLIETDFENLRDNFLIKEVSMDQKIKKINVILDDSLELNKIENIESILNKNNKNIEITFEKIISKLNNANINLLVISSNSKKSYLKDLSKMLKLYDISIFGIILKIEENK